jgi:Fe-S cluster biogenesis protein NfuA
MTTLRLVYGANQSQREQAIKNQINPTLFTMALLEGGAVDNAGLDSLATIKVVRMAPGCPCCSGNLTMRVMLNRALKEKPDLVFLSLANSMHLTAIRDFLQEDQYSGRLNLGFDIDCEAVN